jgi:uncharacterized Zn-finger protein
MKRNPRHARNPEYLDWLTKNEKWCALCEKKFRDGEIVELHHAKGSDWAVNCKSHESIHIDYRALRLHGPATDSSSCHTKVFVDKPLQTRLVIEQLRRAFGDCALSDKLTEAGYRGPA